MKNTLKRLLCIVLCLCTLMPTTAYMSFAAQAVKVGTVSSITLVSKTPSSIRFKWSKVKNATGYQVVFYNAKTKKWVVEKNTTALNYTDTGLNELTTYYYRVRAFVKKGGKVTYGKYSPKLAVKTAEAPVVVGRVEPVTVSGQTDSSVTIKWPKVAGATGYRVYFYSETQRMWIDEASVTGLSYTDTALLPGTAYSYRVRAFVKKNGKITYGKYSSTIKAQTLPTAVTGLKIDGVTENSISVSWEKSRGATAYEIYDINYKGEKSLLASVSGTKYTAEGLASLSKHNFSVRSVAKTSVATTYSAFCDAVTGKTLLSTVESIRLLDLTKDRIEFAWDDVNGADEYTISYRDANSGKWIDVITTKDTVFSFENLKPGTEYNIRFLVSSGTEKSKYSQTFRLCNVPTAPSNLKAATTSDKSVALTWDGVVGADGYKIYRYSPLDGTNALVGTTNECSFNDKDVTTDTRYTYKVCAYVTINGEDKYSDEITVEHNYEAAKDPNNPYANAGQIGAAGLLGYLYDPERDVFYTAKDPWQRNFGFNVIYDVSAQFIFINYNTERYKFSTSEKDWMIQLWKGQYGLVFYGGEVGVYTKPKDRAVDHYDCASDEDMLRMSVNFYYYDKAKEQWQFRFERPYALYWWCTGFKFGNNGYNFSVYRMDIRITMKNFEMLKSLTAAMDAKGMKYNVDGLDLYFTWI